MTATRKNWAYGEKGLPGWRVPLVGMVLLALALASPGQVAVSVETIGGGVRADCGPSAGFVGGNTYTTARYNGPWAGALDSLGNLYIADRTNSDVEQITQVGNRAGSDTIHLFQSYQFTNASQNVSTRTNFPGAIGVAVDSANNLYILTTNLLVKLDPYQNLLGVTSLGNLISATPTAIAVGNDASANIFISFTNQSSGSILRLPQNPAGTFTTVVGNFSFGPAGLAMRQDGQLAVSDTLNNGIYVVATNNNSTPVLITGGLGRGYVDGSPTFAKFDQPHGIAASGDGRMVVCDTLNNRLRIIDNTTNTTTLYGTASNAWTTTCCSCSPALYAGWVDGTAGSSSTSASGREPFSVSISSAGTLYVTELYYNLIRAVTGSGLTPLVTLQPQPAVTNPIIGYVTFPLVNGVPAAIFNPITGTSVVFNNVMDIAIEADPTVETFMTYGPTGSSIPPPSPSSGGTPPIFTAADVGASPSVVPSSIIPVAPDTTIFAIGEATGRQSSSIVTARIQYITANPVISGNNAAAVVLTDATTNAQIYYTLDGTVPVVGASNTIGPVISGQIISFAITTNTTMTAQAFNTGFASSGVVTAQFLPSNFAADALTFGFQSGEGSSEFIAAAGQRFYAPVTLTLIPSAEDMDSLQFTVAITNLPSAPPIGSTFTFRSMLEKPDPANPGEYVEIPPEMFVSPGFQSLMFTNNSLNLLGVGWVERAGKTNLYDTLTQTLISFSQAHDTLFQNTSNQVIVGAFSFVVPPSAPAGAQYQIQIANPSATSDGISDAVFVDAVTNGSLTNGTINSLKTVTVGSARYLVGDVAPFRWFNAGDFGDGTLQDNDVTETFQSAVYGLNNPTPGSDYFDAMDSSDGSDNNLYDGNDNSINTIEFGDGVLAVDDVYVTYRRSLDPSLTWYDRFWSGGVRNAIAVSNTLTKPFIAKTDSHAPRVLSGSPHTITVAADQVTTGGGLSVSVPIRVLAGDTLPLRVLMLNVEVDALDGSPPVTAAVTFSPAANIGSPTMPSSLAANNYAAAWLDSTVAGIASTNIIGALNLTLPANATTNSSYRVHFDHFSASPNGLALFHATVGDGLITVGNRSGSSWHDGIPDSWRLLYFGTVSNLMSAANVDADGDGASNWAEYVAGTNPNDPTSVFQFMPGNSTGISSFTLQWPSVVNKHYTVQCSSTLSFGQWSTVVSNLVGTGQTLQWTDTNSTGAGKFYRALVQ